MQKIEGILRAAWSFGASYALVALIDCVPELEVLLTYRRAIWCFPLPSTLLTLRPSLARF